MLNPILRREAQTSLRSWKIFFVICFYVGLIAVASYIFIESTVNGYAYSNFDPKNIVYLYGILSGLQLGLILIITPALTAGSISGERERQTLDLLIVTKMSPFSIVFGKLISSIGLVLLLIVASMPVYAILFYFGGISIINVFVMTGFLLVTACMVGAMSIMFSSMYKKTLISMVLVYLISGFLCIGTLIAFLVYQTFYINFYLGLTNVSISPSIYGFLFLNPGAGFFSLIDTQLGTNIFGGLAFNYSGSTDIMPVSMWVVNTVANIVCSFIFLKIAAKNINPLRKTK